MPMKILAVANQKGGEGKSTLSVHLAYAAIEAGLRILLVDMDLQGSLSLSFPPTAGAQPGLLASHLFSASRPTLMPEVLSDQVHIIRADPLLAVLVGDSNNRDQLRRPGNNIRHLQDHYDLCLFDTPGNLGYNPPMALGALTAADALVCPFSIGLYETAALGELLQRLRELKTQGLNPRLRLMGLVPSKIHANSKKLLRTLDDLRAQHGSMIMPGRLAERAAVRQSIAARQPVWKNPKTASHKAAAEEWRSMCTAILAKLGEIKK
jgi:chromosome partitioning protein